MWKAPIVEEVRAIREKIFAECGYDIRKLIEREREILKRWKGKVVTKEQLMKERHRAGRKTG